MSCMVHRYVGEPLIATGVEAGIVAMEHMQVKLQNFEQAVE